MQMIFVFRLCIGALLLLHYQNSFAQSLIPRFEPLGVNDGLPHSSVYTIIQDKKGFMWFGTPNGLCRYDGSTLQNFTYTPKNINETVNNYIRGKIHEDNDGNIWYSNESGIYKWNIETEKIEAVRIFNKNEFANVSFQSVCMDEEGSLWLFNVIYGIFQFDIQTKKLQQYPFPFFDKKAVIVFAYTNADNQGNIWLRIVSKNEPLIVFDMKTHSFKTQPSKEPPHACFFGKKNIAFAFDEKLLYKNLVTGKEGIVQKSLDGKKFSFNSQDGIWDNYGRLWMTARGKGLVYYDEVNNRFQRFTHDNSKIKSLPFNLTTCLYIDRSENLWIGMDGGGVAKLDLKPPKFNLFPLTEGDFPVLNDYFTKCFFEDVQGRIWFGSQTNGLNIFDPKTNKLLNFNHRPNNPNSIPGSMVGSIFKDKEGNMWIGSSGGISIFNEKKGHFSTIKINNPPQLYPEMKGFVHKITQLKNGDIIAATFSGIIKIKKVKKGTYEGYCYKHLSFDTNDAVETSDGVIYATASGLGLHKLLPKENGYEIKSVVFKGIDLRCVRIDETDTACLWVGTGKGLIHYNKNNHEYSIWNEKNGLKNSYVYGVLEDEKHNLWLSTNGGLSFFDKLQSRFSNYTYQDGLQSNEFNTQAFYKSKTNTFYFGGIKGFNWFKSSLPLLQIYTPQVSIKQVEINNKAFTKYEFSSSQIRSLPYDSNTWTFHFAALDFTRPQANTVHYKLQGLDKNWISTKTRSATYYNLHPGTYTLIVRASNSTGTWSKEESILFKIKKPFWNTWWFYLLTAILAFGILLFFIKMSKDKRSKKEAENLQRQIALETERNRISQEMHDDIGSGLTQISLISEAAKSQTNKGKEINEELDDISITSRKLVDNIGEIIWSLNPKHNTLDIVLTHLREQLNKLLEYTQIDFKIQFPAALPIINVDDKQCRNILLVTKEIIHNCIKHSGANELFINAEMKGHHLQIIIRDNGKGFDPYALHKGNGLINIRKRIEELKGNLDIVSNADQGTVFIYSFPL